jgi:DNA-binding SARP family transcriptional activator
VVAVAAFESRVELHPRLAIRSLGTFAVERDGRLVGPSEWQSKKARDLLKILVCRRGRPVTREALLEALWPEQDPARTANRLAVALSTARVVLDPARRFASDHFIAADRSAVRLESGRVVVDVERFLTTARAGLTCCRDGRVREGRELLETAEEAYRGEFLEEDLYEDWAVSLREEARAAYVAVALKLAELADAAGEHERATGLRLRVLERDPYDEHAHLDLVSTLASRGSPGEARRAYRRYVARMEAIGVEPAPFPAPGDGFKTALSAVRTIPSGRRS